MTPTVFGSQPARQYSSGGPAEGPASRHDVPNLEAGSAGLAQRCGIGSLGLGPRGALGAVPLASRGVTEFGPQDQTGLFLSTP